MTIEDESSYTNHYYHCGVEWTDDWSCMCDDRCPVCNAEIEPFYSVDNSDNSEIVHAPDVYDLVEGKL
jgi:hypothetical protein